MMIVDIFCRVGFTRCGRFAMLLAVMLSPLWLVGCASQPRCVQLYNSAQDDINNGIHVIEEKNAPMTKAVGLPPLSLSRLPDQTLRDADKYFVRASATLDAAQKSLVSLLDAEDKAQKQCDEDPDLECKFPDAPDFADIDSVQITAQSLDSWIGWVMEIHEAEHLRVAGKEADALKKAYDAYERTDPRLSGGSIPDGIGDDLARTGHADEAMAIDHYAAMIEVMKIRLGPEAVAHPRRLARNPLYWYQGAALEAHLYDYDVDYARDTRDMSDKAVRAEGRVRVRDQGRLALKDLRKAFELGFHDWRMLATDPNFKGLRKLADFRRLVAHYRGLGHSD